MANKQAYKNLGDRNNNPKRDNLPKDAVKKALGSALYWYKREVPKTDEEFAERLNEFFEHCYETNEVPTVEKMCLALGTYREMVWRWETQELKGRLVSHMLKKAKSMISVMDAELAMTGKIQPVVYIFRAKNYYGMRDQVEISAGSAASETAVYDQKQLEARYSQVSFLDSQNVPEIATKEAGFVPESETNEAEKIAENVPGTGTKTG